MEFIECEELTDLRGNRTRDESGVGSCYKVVYYTLQQYYYYLYYI